MDKTELFTGLLSDPEICARKEFEKSRERNISEMPAVCFMFGVFLRLIAVVKIDLFIGAESRPKRPYFGALTDFYGTLQPRYAFSHVKFEE